MVNSEDGDINLFPPTSWGAVTPQNQSLIYAFSSEGEARNNQDVGLDGYDDSQEATRDEQFSKNCGSHRIGGMSKKVYCS